MYILPAERALPVEQARVKRQLRPTSSASASTSASEKQNPLESLISNILNPSEPSTSATSAKTPPPTTKPPAPTASSSTSSVQPISSSSTSSLTTSSTSSQRATSSTTQAPLITPDLTSSDRSTTVVTQTSTSPSTSGTNNASNDGASTTVMTPLVLGIVISASVIFGLIFFSLVVRKLFQFRRRNKKRVSWAENISPFAPTANETGYEKALPRAPAPTPAPAPAPAPAAVAAPIPVAAPVPPPSRMYGPQAASYGAMGAAEYGRPGYGANPDQRGSYYRDSYQSTGPSYASYQNYPAQQPYPPAAPAPYAYNTGAGVAAAAAVGGAAGMAYNNNSAAAPLPALPNPFGVSTVDVAGPVPINVPVAPPAGEQQSMVVTRTFVPNLDDELSIVTGESVRVLAVYDDGWCKVRKLGPDEEEGVVPYECLGGPGAGAQEGLGPDQFKRASSLFEAPQA